MRCGVRPGPPPAGTGPQAACAGFHLSHLGPSPQAAIIPEPELPHRRRSFGYNRLRDGQVRILVPFMRVDEFKVCVRSGAYVSLIEQRRQAWVTAAHLLDVAEVPYLPGPR
ncbi:hypothetical protein GCM10012278_85030 [Nonomuraea glycinis]|uniref:Uncharacterized protein n=1 Tax=Nonomuraea glycinis TaxID=2047744 RepID=A0A918AFE7_9ACTN|nr:hypothetical protein GCM10012278_85030 [Nonomuraea glycinis]